LKVSGSQAVNHVPEQSHDPETGLRSRISAILDGMVTAFVPVIVAGYRLAMDRPDTKQSA
jgi:hypothetical protein